MIGADRPGKGGTIAGRVQPEAHMRLHAIPDLWLTLTALPPSPSAIGATSLSASGVSPRLEAIGMGASMCAASKWPTAIRSRTFAQEVSRTSVRSTPSASANPFTFAATRSALSVSGMNPAVMV